jgi:hypothetical protein
MPKRIGTIQEVSGGDRESSAASHDECIIDLSADPSAEAQVTVDVVKITCEQLLMQALPIMVVGSDEGRASANGKPDNNRPPR